MNARITLTATQLDELATAAAMRAAAVTGDAIGEKVRNIVREELERVGLADDSAGHDVRDLREALQLWRQIRRRAVLMVVIFVLGILGVLVKPPVISWAQHLMGR